MLTLIDTSLGLISRAFRRGLKRFIARSSCIGRPSGGADRIRILRHATAAEVSNSPAISDLADARAALA